MGWSGLVSLYFVKRPLKNLEFNKSAEKYNASQMAWRTCASGSLVVEGKYSKMSNNCSGLLLRIAACNAFLFQVIYDFSAPGP